MEAAARGGLEREVHSLCEQGDLDEAATRALRGYGPEIYSLLLALHRDEDQAAEAFSAFSEHLWKGLGGFSWQCTLRTWAYTVARHASYRQLRGLRHQRQHVAASRSSVAAKLVQEVRTATRSYLQTEVKDRFAAIRASLPPEDQMILVLRVDRGLEWTELARVLHGSESAELDEAAVARESARLRKRFQLLKQRLLARAKELGIGRDR